MIKWAKTWILFGGSLGCLARFGVQNLCDFFWGDDFFFTDILINIIGCFFAGFFYHLSPKKRIFLLLEKDFFLVGFFSAFTTFSYFIAHLIEYIDARDYVLVFENIFLSIAGGFILFLAGSAAAKKI